MTLKSNSYGFIFLMSVLLLLGANVSGQTLYPLQLASPPALGTWGEPHVIELRSKKMREKEVAPVPLKFRTQVEKRVGVGCKLQVEIQNTSTTTDINFTLSVVTNPSLGRNDHKEVKLKAGETTTVELMAGPCKKESYTNDADICGHCNPTVYFEEIGYKVH